MRYEQFLPPPSLRRFVRCFWLLQGHTPAADVVPERVVPDGCAELILHAGSPYRLTRPQEPGTVSQSQGALVGQIARAIELLPTGPTEIVGVRFEPAGARDLVGVPMSEVTGRSIPLRDLWGTEGADLTDRVREAGDAATRAALVCDVLLRRAARVRRRDDPADAAVSVLERADGQIDIADLARTVGVGRRTLERRFLDRVGLPPKRLARILRLQAVLQTLDGTDAPDWAMLAAGGGFYDQPHLVREFRDLTGLPPAAYARSVHPVHDFATS